jgi:uncharacterized protein YjbJ (UPF0337 family)
MNWDEIKGNWKTATGQMKSHWGKLTDDDMKQIDGKREELAGRLQSHYGHSKEEVEKHIDEFLKKI